MEAGCLVSREPNRVHTSHYVIVGAGVGAGVTGAGPGVQVILVSLPAPSVLSEHVETIAGKVILPPTSSTVNGVTTGSSRNCNPDAP